MSSVSSSGAGTTQAAHFSTLRNFSRSTLELAGLTGVLVRLYRATFLSLDSFSHWAVLIAALSVGMTLLFAILSWHLSNYPIRKWPSRVAMFVGVELAAELGTSSVLIALRMEPLGSGIAGWEDWWPMAGQTILERTLSLGAYAGLLAGAMWLVTRRTRVDP